MKLHNIRMISAVAIAALALTACNDNDNKEDIRTVQTFTDCYAAVTDLNTNTTSYVSDMRVGLELNWTQATADFSITGLRTSANLPVISFGGVQWGMAGSDTQWMKASSTALTANTNTYDTYTLKDFDFHWIDRSNLGAALGQPYGYFPQCSFSFELDGQYRVVGARNPFIAFGSTVSTAPDGATFESKKTYYLVTVDVAHMTASIGIANAQFAAAMPALDMIFPDVPVTIDANGLITMSATQPFIPTLSDKVPQPNYPITSLQGTIDPINGINLEFTCNVMQRMEYTVTSTLGFTDFSNLSD